MKSILSPNLVKRSLSSHSWIGLLAAAFMYMICLSGTVVVLYPDFERWEQPNAPEFVEYDPDILDKAYANLVADGVEISHHMYLDLPTKDMPRATISNQEQGWFIRQDGSLAENVAHDWTHILINLHNYLHLPSSFGMIFVSIMGVQLCALIISGFLAHPSIFKDAFSFRRQGSKRLEQLDLHNRLSVWGAPFYLMIGITGAFFGLASLASLVAAGAFYGGDTAAVSAAIYGAEPDLQQEARQPAIANAVKILRSTTPDTPPFFVTIEEADTPEKQYMIIGARHYDRMIWGEQHRFDAAGNYLDKVGFADGDAGRQAIFSIYRLHFGHFDGWLVKLGYIIFGLALTVISASGVNIWLARRKKRDYLNNLWTGLVWGTPAALALSAFTQVVLGLPSQGIFWLGLLASLGLSQRLGNDVRSKIYLQLATSGLLAALVAGHVMIFGSAAFGPAALTINITLFVTALLFLSVSLLNRRHNSADIPAVFGGGKSLSG